MSINFEDRPAYVLDLPLPEDTELLRPEQTIVRFAHSRTIDVGALCYLKREESSRGKRRTDRGLRVVYASRVSSRVTAVRKLVRLISDQVLEGVTPETLRDRYSRFIPFMRWADESNFVTVLENRGTARKAFAAYVAHLRDRVARNDGLTNNAGARQQDCVLVVLEDLLGIEDLARGLNLLRTNHRSTKSTTPPDEAAQGRVLDLCTSLFNGICTLTLEKATYPHRLVMPPITGLPEDTLWVQPTTQWFKTPAILLERHGKWTPSWGYDFANGRVATLDELRAQGALKSDAIRRTAIRNACAQIAAANADLNHPHRRALAGVGMNSFLMLFLAQTGMNWAQLRALPWSDDFVVESSRQAFRTIKARAGGKTVAFELPIAFMPFFRKFLELRQFRLQGRECEFLFFVSGTRGTGDLVQMGYHVSSVYKTFQRMDPGLPRVLPREWRAAKSDWLVRNTDPATAALVLQNTEKTVLRSYAEGSETVAMEEMGAFLDGVSATVVDRSAQLPDSTSRAVGKCVKYGEPVAQEGAAIEPDCRGPEGCLFCDKFKLHADEVDTRKLLSCRYCIQQTTSAMGTEERFQQRVSPVIKRIDTLLAEISTRDAAMVETIAKEVEQEGKLSPYWAAKLEMLMELGLV